MNSPRLYKVLLPVIIGLAVVIWLFYKEFDVETWRQIHFDWRVVACLALAWVFMFGRDFGLTWRFRALTNRELSWGSAIKVNLLCEFTSCVTPSAVGGSSLGMVFMHSEGIELGRATTLMLTTLFLDELFFVVALPVVMLLVPYDALFGFSTTFSRGLQGVFWIVYGVIFLWTTILFIALLVKPSLIKRMFTTLFRLRFLRRWAPKIEELTDNMTATSADLKSRPMRWWLENFFATALTWTSRFLVVNALFLGFAPNADQIVVLGRQFVVWVVLMVSPTPGGSGLRAWLFTEYYGDLLPSAGIAVILAVFWRIITYYVYLLAGAILVPSWLRKTVGKK